MAGRERVDEPLVSGHQLGVAAVPVVAGEERLLAKVLAAFAAVAAAPVGKGQPGHADPFACLEPPSLDGFLYDTHHLVAGNHRVLVWRQLAIGDVKVGPADPAGMHADEHLPAYRSGIRQFPLDEGLFRRLEDHRPHVTKVRSLLGILG